MGRLQRGVCARPQGAEARAVACGLTGAKSWHCWRGFQGCQEILARRLLLLLLLFLLPSSFLLGPHIRFRAAAPRHALAVLRAAPENPGLLILVTGKMTIPGNDHPLPFAHVFEVQQDATGPFISNEMFEFVVV